jgi:hypothetical protein
VQILRRLEGVVEASAQPADEPDLVFLTRGLQLPRPAPRAQVLRRTHAALPSLNASPCTPEPCSMCDGRLLFQTYLHPS